MLLVDHLLRADPDRPCSAICSLDRWMTPTHIGRQATCLFERAAMTRRQGASVDDLSKLYFENLRDQFGESLDLSEDFRHEWLCIPHIYHTPSTCMLCFGQLLVLSLYEQYGGRGTASAVLSGDLAAGGSDSPVRIWSGQALHRSPEFWRQGSVCCSVR